LPIRPIIQFLFQSIPCWFSVLFGAA
jgi:hypothetical protein